MGQNDGYLIGITGTESSILPTTLKIDSNTDQKTHTEKESSLESPARTSISTTANREAPDGTEHKPNEQDGKDGKSKKSRKQKLTNKEKGGSKTKANTNSREEEDDVNIEEAAFKKPDSPRRRRMKNSVLDPQSGNDTVDSIRLGNFLTFKPHNHDEGTVISEVTF